MRPRRLAALPVLRSRPGPASASRPTSSLLRSVGANASACPARRRGARHERGVQVDHVTIYRWARASRRCWPMPARPCHHHVVDRWQVDETYVKIAGQWRSVYRAIDQSAQVIEVFVAARRDASAAHLFFEQALRTTSVAPAEIVTDQAPMYPAVLEE